MSHLTASKTLNKISSVLVYVAKVLVQPLGSLEAVHTQLELLGGLLKVPLWGVTVSQWVDVGRRICLGDRTLAVNFMWGRAWRECFFENLDES